MGVTVGVWVDDIVTVGLLVKEGVIVGVNVLVTV